MKIYCLFSISNDYYQPRNNLICFWTERSFSTSAVIEAISESGGFSSEGVVGRISDACFNSPEEFVRSGRSVRVGGYDFRVEEVNEKEILQLS